MKTPVLFFAIALITASFSAAHGQSTSITKKVEIDDDGKNPRVTIETTVNGKTTKEVLTGDQAREYIEENQDDKSDGQSVTSSSIVNLRITSEDIDELQQELHAMSMVISDEVDKATQEVQKINMDSLLESVGVQIEQSFNELKYEFTTTDGESKSVIVMKSTDQKNGDEDTKVDVEVTTNGGKTDKTVVIEKRSIIIEDEAEPSDKPVKIDDLHFFPNPATNTLTLEFENEKPEPITIEITDLSGRVYHVSTVAGTGSKRLSIDVNNLSAGNYLLRLSQDDRITVKKLVIE